MLVIGLVAAVSFAVQLAGMKARDSQTTPAPDAWNWVFQGDLSVKQALAGLPGVDRKDAARRAIGSYSSALPAPDAYRRIAVTKQAILNESGIQEFNKLDSPGATKHLSGEKVRKLSEEVAMWRDIYAPGEITPAQAARFVSRVGRLDLGPLRSLAIAEVYKRSGQDAKAAAAARKAKQLARSSVAGIIGLIAVLVVGGILGLVLAIRFLAKYGALLRGAPRPRIQASVLVLSFLTYAIAALVLAIAAGLVLTLGGVEEEGGADDLVYLAAQALASLGGLALGLAVLRALTAYTGENLREMGLKLVPFKEAAKWGIGGYLASLPFLGGGLAVTLWLSRTVFKNVPTPDQPFAPILATGGPAAIVLVFVLAAVIAPVVEEVFFRGALYTALRGGMGVWPSVLLSAAIFAVGHPLPGGFLLILVLGSVLALVREKTGSLVPSIVCHAVYNTVLLSFVMIIY